MTDAFVPIDAYVGLAARGTPAATALVATNTSYARLEAAVARAAGALRGLCVERGDRVAIWLPKGSGFVVTLLAVLRAGAVYVPLGIEQPGERVSAIVRDSGARVIVTHAARAQKLREAVGETARVVLADADAVDHVLEVDADASFAPIDVDSGSSPQTLAAILYTSGSTGMPKGVTVSHGNLSFFMLWAVRETGVAAADVFANHASFNFDLSTFDIFAALCVGASLWIVPDEDQRSPAALVEGIRKHRVSVWYSVPSVLGLLIDARALTSEIASTLRVVAVAGEVLPLRTLRALGTRLPREVRLFNWYGPTETNVCTSYRVRDRDFERDSPLPIGRPLRGLSVRIEGDEGGRSAGELVVSGPCVTPGYWNRTSDPNTTFHARGEHATGDIVAYDDGGELVYRGRCDRMVKLNGFRVELGEVETVLSQHSAIREVAVVAVEAARGARLAAYYCSVEGSSPPSVLELKTFCSGRLPRYMIPATFERLPALPRNQNGKVDALLLLARSRVSDERRTDPRGAA